MVHRGVRTIPTDADVFLFLISDGKIHNSFELPEQITLGDLTNPIPDRLWDQA
jgi:hypothetical protein